jgi:hypothetical protein
MNKLVLALLIVLTVSLYACGGSDHNDPYKYPKPGCGWGLDKC